MTRIVLDTNVVVSALVWGGTPYQLIRMAIDGDVVLHTSLALLDELRDVLTRPHLAARIGQRHASAKEAVTLYASLTILVSPVSVPRVVPGDADDDHVIAAAVAAKAALIVSGDRHLLTLRDHGTMRIVTPSEAVRLLSLI